VVGTQHTSDVVRLATIATQADIVRSVRALVKACPAMATAHATVGTPPLRRWQPGFEGLVRIVVGQQLSVASAAAIHGRVVTSVVPLDARTLAMTGDEVLKAAGLSRGKIVTLRALASTVLAGQLDFAALAGAPADEVRARLILVPGIGPWTADIYLMFCRGDQDAFATGDLALQVGVQALMDLPERPTAPELFAIAERWRPHRGVAARLVWAYYGHLKGLR
jgi:DNA-3-methyladenine glycosylase II